MMRQFFLRTICVWALAALTWGAPGGKAECVGGTVAALERVEGRLSVAGDSHLQFSRRGEPYEVPYTRINLIEYGQNVNRRIGAAVVINPLFLLSKSRKHFLTVGFTDAQGRQQAIIFRVEKHDIRALLVGLEARTGLRVQYQDDEARKAGKG